MYNLWYCNNRDIYIYIYTVTWYPSLYCLSVQRLENPKRSVVYCGAPTHTHNNTIIQTIIQDKIVKVIDLEGILEEIANRIVEKVTEMKGMETITIEIGIDQGREPFQEIIEGTEALAMIGLDQGPELVQTGIG